ncbi:MAG: antitoxin, partial [Candidatus Omnitrophica bacterium]|nr:antitoxin [Candidatus Omnitrophota bacterium]
MRKIAYTKEEKELLDSVERGEGKSVKYVAEEKKRYARIAKNTLKKNKRINIRISDYDLAMLQDKAVEEGLPYQTLMA